MLRRNIDAVGSGAGVCSVIVPQQPMYDDRRLNTTAIDVGCRDGHSVTVFVEPLVILVPLDPGFWIADYLARQVYLLLHSLHRLPLIYLDLDRNCNENHKQNISRLCFSIVSM